MTKCSKAGYPNIRLLGNLVPEGKFCRMGTSLGTLYESLHLGLNYKGT